MHIARLFRLHETFQVERQSTGSMILNVIQLILHRNSEVLTEINWTTRLMHISWENNLAQNPAVDCSVFILGALQLMQ